MLELDVLKQELSQFETSLYDVINALNIDDKENRIKEIEDKMNDQHFWDDVDQANEEVKELKHLKNIVDDKNYLITTYEDSLMLIEISKEENDLSVVPEIEENIQNLKNKVENIKLSMLLNSEYDNKKAIVSLHAGAGGTESCDFCSMLYRMYQRYADKNNFELVLLDYLDGEEAGIKSITFEINGINAYGYMKSEKGVHRLVRISPFNAAGKRQTSFVSCDVIPDIDEEIEIEIRDEDLKIDTYRASGAGGQHVNKVSSAVRITHLPTGIVVACQKERSQFMNKDKAMQMLKSKLYLLKQQENEEKLKGIQGAKTDNAFGSQIRSYVLQPYTLVKDHRTNFENNNAQAVLDGNLEPFMNAYLKYINS